MIQQNLNVPKAKRSPAFWRTLFFITLLLPSTSLAKENPASAKDALRYWQNIDPTLKDHAFKKALQKRLQKTHKRLSYKQLWRAYQTTDTHRCKDGGLSDFYSSKCWRPEQKCKNFKREGDCFNREHSWPKSWYKGKKTSTPYTDLHVVVPSDGYVNSRRSNLPYGEVEVDSINYESSNGSKSGRCKDPALGKRCFEPNDALKGDLARIHFYFTARYADIFLCCKREATDRAFINPVYENLLLSWHKNDPVDDPERKRNEGVYKIQGNRNPFVDHPEWVARISDF